MARPVAIDRKGFVGYGHIYFVLSGAEPSIVISTSDTPIMITTDLESDAGKTEDGLCDRIKLKGVNVLLVPKWEDQPLRIRPHI